MGPKITFGGQGGGGWGGGGVGGGADGEQGKKQNVIYS